MRIANTSWSKLALFYEWKAQRAVLQKPAIVKCVAAPLKSDSESRTTKSESVLQVVQEKPTEKEKSTDQLFQNSLKKKFPHYSEVEHVEKDPQHGDIGVAFESWS